MHYFLALPSHLQVPLAIAALLFSLRLVGNKWPNFGPPFSGRIPEDSAPDPNSKLGLLDYKQRWKTSEKKLEIELKKQTREMTAVGKVMESETARIAKWLEEESDLSVSWLQRRAAKVARTMSKAARRLGKSAVEYERICDAYRSASFGFFDTLDPLRDHEALKNLKGGLEERWKAQKKLREDQQNEIVTCRTVIRDSDQQPQIIRLAADRYVKSLSRLAAINDRFDLIYAALIAKIEAKLNQLST